MDQWVALQRLFVSGYKVLALGWRNSQGEGHQSGVSIHKAYPSSSNSARGEGRESRTSCSVHASTGSAQTENVGLQDAVRTELVEVQGFSGFPEGWVCFDGQAHSHRYFPWLW